MADNNTIEKATKRLRRTDISGVRFGKLTAVERAGKKPDKSGKNETLWLCKCDCGNTKIVGQHTLVCGGAKSCGCLRKRDYTKPIIKHGMSRTRIYRTYYGMLYRCYLENDPHYPDYGARGIKVCDEWQGENGFINFYNWAMENGYTDNLTIDRIDVNGNYEPLNCRWADATTQQNNKRDNHRYLVNGEYLTARQISIKYNININTFIWRIHNMNITAQEAVDYKAPLITITYHGVTKPLIEWAKEKRLPARLLRDRLKLNYPEEYIFSEPFEMKRRSRRRKK